MKANQYTWKHPRILQAGEVVDLTEDIPFNGKYFTDGPVTPQRANQNETH
jgi:hypothetical protein